MSNYADRLRVADLAILDARYSHQGRPMQRLLLYLSLLLFSAGLWAGSEIQRSTLILDLEFRSAEQVILGLNPHLEDGVAVSGQGQRLLISGPADQVDAIKELAGALDQPEESYRLVFAQGRLNLEERQISSSRSYSTSRNDLISLRLTAGIPARLERGFWVPTSKADVWSEQTDYQWMAGGVWVLAKSRGDEVVLVFSSRTLEPERRLSQPLQPPGFSGSEVESQLRLQPGQWQTLASEGQLRSADGKNRRSFSTQTSEYYYSVCIERLSENQQCPMN